MKSGKGACKCLYIIPSIIAIISIVVNIYQASHSHNLKIQLEKAKEPKFMEEIEILADSRKINHKYETKALIKIKNLGLTREKDKDFEIRMDPSYEIIDFIRKKGLINELGEKRRSYCRVYNATIYGQDKIEGTLIFLSHIEFKKGDICPIEINW